MLEEISRSFDLILTTSGMHYSEDESKVTSQEVCKVTSCELMSKKPGDPQAPGSRVFILELPL